MNDATHGQAPEDEEKTNALYEDIFHYLGEFGRYQKRLYFLLCLPAISCALHKLGGVFLQAKPAHRCRLPNEDSTVEYSLPSGILNMTYPWDDKTGAWSSCLILNTNFTPEYYASGVPATASVPCTSWVYDTSLYASSTVMETKLDTIFHCEKLLKTKMLSEGRETRSTVRKTVLFKQSSASQKFNLVCEDSWIPATTDAMFMFGDLIGSVTFGYFSDRFGRRPIFFTSLIIQSIAGIGAALMPNALTFGIARFIIGLTASALYIASFILAVRDELPTVLSAHENSSFCWLAWRPLSLTFSCANGKLPFFPLDKARRQWRVFNRVVPWSEASLETLELVGPSKRLFAAMTYAYFFTTGYVLSALFSYLLNNWRYLQVAMTVPGLFLLTYWWILPESSRWLLSKGRQTEAKQILNKVAKTNNVVIPEKVLDNLGAVTTNDDEGKGKHSALDLVRYPNLRNRSLNIFFNWFVISCTYFGLSWNSSSLGGNDYLNFLISGLVEIPAPGLLILTLDRWGRKPLFTGTMLLTASVLLLSNLIPQG
ncbi:unnamed protein product, partial [Timema podura]|nr:unnamed protein product [Timema podura]